MAEHEHETEQEYNPMLCAAPDFVDVAAAATEEGLGHHFAPVGGAGSAFGALGLVTGPAGVMIGLHEYEEGKKKGDVEKEMQGALGVVAGGAGTVDGASTLLAAALGGGGAGAGVSAVAAPIAAVAGAGAAGLAAGTVQAQIADSKYTKTGLWGKGDDGNNLSAMDWGASWGAKWDHMMGNTGPSIGGGIASGLGGIAGGSLGVLQAGYHYLNGDKM